MIWEQPTSTGLQRPHDPDPVPAGLEAVLPCLRGIGLHEERLGRGLPEAKRWGPRCLVHDPRRGDREAGVFSAVEQTDEQLQEDLRLDVAPHRADELGQGTVGTGDEGRRQRVGRTPARAVLGGMAGLQGETDAAIVEEDPGLAGDQMAIRNRARWTG